MSDSSPDPRIEHLKKLKCDLAEDFAALNQSKNSVYSEHLSQLETIRDSRRKELEDWAANERASAMRYRDGQYYQVESNYEERIRQVDTRVSDFLAFKIKLLREKFPGPSKYFESHGYVWPVVDSQPSPPPHRPRGLEIKVSDEPLLSPTEIAEDVRLISRILTHPANGHALLDGIHTGDEVSLQIPGVPAIAGVLGAFTNQYVEFKMQNGKTLNISFRALELKYAAITRK
jgi:hypothetical protein